MKVEFDTIDGMLTIKEALIGMKYVENKCLIVEKRHDDDEYGLLLISDIARKVLAKDRALDRVNVYEVMQKPVIAVTPNMDIRYCARLLDQFNITRDNLWAILSRGRRALRACLEETWFTGVRDS